MNLEILYQLFFDFLRFWLASNLLCLCTPLIPRYNFIYFWVTRCRLYDNSPLKNNSLPKFDEYLLSLQQIKFVHVLDISR